MLTRESLFLIVYSLPIYQLLFYTAQLITLKRSNPSRKYLGLMLLIITIFLIINAIYHLGYTNYMSRLYFIFVPLLLSVLPVFYLYIVSLARENHDVDDRSRFILLLPPIVILMLNLILYRSLTSADKLIFLQNGFQSSGEAVPAVSRAVILHWSGIAALLVIQLVLAVIGVYKALRRGMEVMHKQPRHLAFLKFQWILIISFFVMVFLVSSSVFNLFGPARELAPAIVYNVLALVSGGLIGYYGMKQDALLMQVSKVRTNEPVIPDGLEPVTSASVKETLQKETPGFISNDEIDQIVTSLEKLMKQQKPYLNPKYSLPDLSEQLEVSRRKVTYVINEVMEKNFYGVINDYRIEEAIRLLEDSDNKDYKMDTIAEMVGFQSKSSFYACFKKYTGLTPTEYRLHRKN